VQQLVQSVAKRLQAGAKNTVLIITSGAVQRWMCQSSLPCRRSRGFFGQAAGILIGSLPACRNDLWALPLGRAGSWALPPPTPGTRELTFRWALPALGCRQ
jgi:hypothetical protein